MINRLSRDKILNKCCVTRAITYMTSTGYGACEMTMNKSTEIEKIRRGIEDKNNNNNKVIITNISKERL